MSIEVSTTVGLKDELSQEYVWTLRDEAIRRGFNLPTVALIEALPASGKSRGAVEWAAATGKPLTVLAPRHDLLDEYEKWCKKKGLDYYRPPSFYRDCASFEEGEDNSQDNPINDRAQDLKDGYEAGFDGVGLHATHPDAPCQDNGECPYVRDRAFNPEKFDVILGTYRHGHIENWIEDRYVVFDEFPKDAFLKTFDEGVAPVVSAYLQDKDMLPFTDYMDLVDRRDSVLLQDSIEEWKAGLHPSLYDSVHARRSPNSSAHAQAPLATLALIEMMTLQNGWRYADLGQGRVGVRNPKKNKWTFLLPLDLSSAESVIGLDGTPNAALWELALNEPIESISLLTPPERCAYLQDVLQLWLIQTTENWKAIQGGGGAAPPTDLAMLEGIARMEGRPPALITSKKAKKQYERHGLERITEIVEHYSNLKGMNDFSEERLGVVLGNPHPGDDEIEMWGAFAGEPVKRKEVDGEELTGNDTDYGPFGNQVMETFIHDEVLQAAMRFGRKEVDGERGATVYINTSAIPEWVPVEKRIPEIHAWTGGKDGKEDESHGVRDTIEAIQSLDGWRDGEWKATALYDRTGISDRQVRTCLEMLSEEGYLEFCGKKGQGGALHYANLCVEEAGQFGHVEFPE